MEERRGGERLSTLFIGRNTLPLIGNFLFLLLVRLLVEGAGKAEAELSVLVVLGLG